MRSILLLALAPLAAAVSCQGDADAPAAMNGSTFTVSRAPLRITLTEKGTLRAKNSVQILPEIKNPAKVVWLVGEGTSVKEGDVLAELDKAGLEKDLESLEDQVLQLEADVKSARTDVDIQVSDNSSAVQKAELDLDLAERDLERYENGDLIQDERAKVLRVATAESDLERAREKAKETPELLREGFITPLEAEEEALKIRKLDTELDTARLDLELWRKYTNPMELKRRRSKVEEGTREVDRARKLAESRLTAKAVVLKQKERRYESAVSKLEETRQELEHMTIRATGPGVVVYAQTGRWDAEELKVGDTAYPGRPIMVLPDLSEVQVELDVHEADITKLRRRQPAVVTLESYKDLVLTAEVTRIATVGTSQGRWDSTKRFSVVVEIQEKDLDLRPGISARVEILIDEIPDTLAVPIQAVFAREGTFYCWVLAGGEPERRIVQPGRSNDHFVQILEGLEAGSEVLLHDPEAGAEAPPEEEAGSGSAG